VWRLELKTLQAITDPSSVQILPIKSGKHLADHATVDNDLKADWSFRIIGILRPT
jgi:hypothetical protein